MDAKNLSTLIYDFKVGIPTEGSGMMVIPMPKRKEGFPAALDRAMKDRRRTVKDIAERAAERRMPIGASTIREILLGNTADPGVKTIEKIAAGLDMPPLELLAYALDDPPASDARYEEGYFKTAHAIYASLKPSARTKADLFLQSLIEVLKQLVD